MTLLPTILSAIASILVWLLLRFSFHRNFIMAFNLKRYWIYIFDFFFLFSAVFRFIARAELKSHLIEVLIESSYVLLGFFGLMAIILFILDVMTLAARFQKKVSKQAPEINESDKLSRRNFLKNNFTVAAVAGSGVITGVGFANSFDPKVVTVNIPLKDQFHGLKGLKVVQLSDVHIGPTLKADFTKALVEKVNKLNPDIIVITGDLADGKISIIGEDLLPFKNLKSVYGTYFVTGNHEYYWDTRELCDFISGTLGIKILTNENTKLTYNNFPFYLVGVTDISSRRYDPANACDPKKAMINIPTDAYKILLSHQPKTCFETSKLKYDVQLSGHTHGGQGFPWNIIVYFIQPYVKGLHKVEDMHLYVNSGAGFWGPPNRFMINSEITEIIFS